MGLTREQRAKRKADQAASDARVAASRQEAANALRLNRCPKCAGPVRTNGALTGWVQCAQYGAEGFRLDSSRPSCSWQGFMA